MNTVFPGHRYLVGVNPARKTKNKAVERCNEQGCQTIDMSVDPGWPWLSLGSMDCLPNEGPICGLLS